MKTYDQKRMAEIGKMRCLLCGSKLREEFAAETSNGLFIRLYCTKGGCINELHAVTVFLWLEGKAPEYEARPGLLPRMRQIVARLSLRA